MWLIGKFLCKVARNSRSGSHHLGELLVAWWQVRDINALNLSLADRLNHTTYFFLCFGLCFLWPWLLMQLRNEETRSFEWFTCNKLRLSALTSHTRHQVSKMVAPRSQILSYFRREFHRIGKLFGSRKFWWVTYLCIIFLLAKRKNLSIFGALQLITTRKNLR